MSNTLRIHVAEYRLKYKQPFGTAHGIRDGTDAVFLRIGNGIETGMGEVAMPPYIPESQASVMECLYKADLQGYITALIKSFPEPVKVDLFADRPVVRNLVSMAVHDLIARSKGITVASLIGGIGTLEPLTPRALVTLGHMPNDEIPHRVLEVPNGFSIKLKIGTDHDRELVSAFLDHSDHDVLLDGNQGCQSVDELLWMVERIGKDRVIGIEQPFLVDDLSSIMELTRSINVPVFADESVQVPGDPERVGHVFSGVNIKLMKCGGLDRARTLIDEARSLGLKVMLGCMSESSLGCAAMAQLQGLSDVIDLDGPWLLSNDPFSGLDMEVGLLAIRGQTGIGVNLSASLNWIQIGA